jgi:hypothetical protein
LCLVNSSGGVIGVSLSMTVIDRTGAYVPSARQGCRPRSAQSLCRSRVGSPARGQAHGTASE